jgi:hypothetical protein
MKAKAIREQREAEEQAKPASTGVKRSFASMTTEKAPATVRDASVQRPLDAIRPARNFAKYVEYDFSKMTDTKGGFLTEEDDPHNRALHVRDENAELKPAHMTQREWERQQLLQNLRRERAGPFEPGLSVLDEKAHQKACRECGTLEIDWKWEESFKCCVCSACKEKFPEKYSMLTKTEAKEDYLLTDRKLPDPNIPFDRAGDDANVIASGTARRRTSASPRETQSAQGHVEQHDALPSISSRGVRLLGEEVGVTGSTGCRIRTARRGQEATEGGQIQIKASRPQETNACGSVSAQSARCRRWKFWR